jgi:hypothetical protein
VRGADDDERKKEETFSGKKKENVEMAAFVRHLSLQLHSTTAATTSEIVASNPNIPLLFLEICKFHANCYF